MVGDGPIPDAGNRSECDLIASGDEAGGERLGDSLGTAHPEPGDDLEDSHEDLIASGSKGRPS
jgi:hypothetical protein